jgi:hypothetical protein
MLSKVRCNCDVVTALMQSAAPKWTGKFCSTLHAYPVTFAYFSHNCHNTLH